MYISVTVDNNALNEMDLAYLLERFTMSKINEEKDVSIIRNIRVAAFVHHFRACIFRISQEYHTLKITKNIVFIALLHRMVSYH